MDDFESVLDNANSHLLLSVVASVHHERAYYSLDNWHLRFSELLRGVSSGSVRQEHWRSDLNVVLYTLLVTPQLLSCILLTLSEMSLTCNCEINTLSIRAERFTHINLRVVPFSEESDVALLCQRGDVCNSLACQLDEPAFDSGML